MRKNKWLMSVMLIILLSKMTASCQSGSDTIVMTGKYRYATSHYTEELELKENGTFINTVKTEFLRFKTVGNWQFRKDSIILDSRPQRDRLFVLESRKKKKNNVFIVMDKDGYYMTYHLILTLRNGEKVVLRDQFKKSAFKGAVESFKIIDTKGLHSPEYKVKGESANFFTIFFESARVFENEGWYIKNEKIRPKAPNGKEQIFELIKTNDR